MQSGLLSDHVPLSTTFKCVLGLLVALGIITTGVSIGAVVESARAVKKLDDLKTSSEASASSSSALPSYYAVPDVYLLPATNQDGLGTCWAFGTMYLFSSQYRAQGVAQGLLEDNATHTEYVPFSVQAYFSLLGKRCREEWTPACSYGGLMYNSSEDQQIESVYYFSKAWQNFTAQLLPDAVCPYNFASDDPNFDYFNCSGLDAAIQGNPIKWSVKSITMAYETEKIKRLLFGKKRALGIGTPLPGLVYYPSCDGLFVNTTACQNRVYPCPDGDGYCYKLTLSGRHQDGVFLAETDPKRMYPAGGHAMNIVGYNDDWVFHERFQTVSGADLPVPLRGGFILHNSWSAERGHTVQYLLGNTSQENEDITCPNHLSPDTWIPASYACVLEGFLSLNQTVSAEDGPRLACPKAGERTIQRVRGKHGLWQWADVLKCQSSSMCDTNESVYYLLAKAAPGSGDANVKYLSSGLHEINLIRVNLSSSEESPDVSNVTISRLPFWALSTIFSPVDLKAGNKASNDPDHCGYWMLPYTALENVKRINWDLLDNFRVVDLELEFLPRSYWRSPESKNFDTSLLKQSSAYQTKLSFDGPIPFERIYTPPPGAASL